MPGSSTTCLTDDMVLEFVRGSLGEASLRNVEAHLSRCPDCCALIAEASQAVWPHLDRASPESELLRPGTEVSRYVIEAALGAGAAGVVYRARDPELQRSVAL